MDKELWKRILDNSEILSYYDGPQLLTGLGYLVLRLAGDERFLVVRPTTGDLHKFMNSKLCLRSVISNCSLFWIVEENSVIIELNELPDNDDLPDPGFYL